MPAANGAVFKANHFVKALPGAQMWFVRTASKALLVLKRAPILDERHPTVAEECSPAQEPLLQMRTQGVQHRSHRPNGGDPLAEGEEVIDPHTTIALGRD